MALGGGGIGCQGLAGGVVGSEALAGRGLKWPLVGEARLDVGATGGYNVGLRAEGKD